MHTKETPNTTTPRDSNEGEGNRTAARHYNEAVTRSAKDGAHVEAAAKEAEAALDSAEGADLQRAEAEGKARGKD